MEQESECFANMSANAAFHWEPFGRHAPVSSHQEYLSDPTVPGKEVVCTLIWVSVTTQMLHVCSIFTVTFTIYHTFWVNEYVNTPIHRFVMGYVTATLVTVQVTLFDLGEASEPLGLQ